MFIQSLKIHNFRNIKYKEFLFSKNINVFYGENGVGKTSLLEAIYFLSTAKTFRKSSSKSIINFDSDTVTVYSKSDQLHSLAISKHKNGKWIGKVNNDTLKKQSDISSYLKVIAIDPEVYRLVDFGPQYRRSFLDWFVFHVEHRYIEIWKKLNKCIKQLNLLYKSKAPETQIDLWENSFIQFSEALTLLRKKYFEILKPTILQHLKEIQPEVKNINITFKQGWTQDISLDQQLKADRERNLRYGQLQSGPHKMDIKITINQHSASHTLSRGQKKSLSIVFYMAYIDYLVNVKNEKPIVCLDDLDAELDLVKLSKISSFFEKLNIQAFISSVDVSKLKSTFNNMQMFHVKH